MIVRILGHGQWVLDPDQLLALNELDVAVEKAVADQDPEALRTALADLNAAVRGTGVEVPYDVIVESDLVLPDADASIEEVRVLLEAQTEYYGLIPDGPGNPSREATEGTVTP